MTRTARYGVDGYPYLIGLGMTASTLVPAGVIGAFRATGRARTAAAISLVTGVAAAIPTGLGLRYVVRGKTALRDRVLDAVAWSGDEVVVDLGAGGGLLGIGAAQRTTGLVHCVDLFIGKDLSSNSAGRLRDNAAIEGVLDQIVVHEKDIRALALPDASVDVVVSALCLHNIPDPAGRRDALSEARRILCEGGTLVISDLAHVDDEYVPALRELGFDVDATVKVPATFPPQRMVVARRGTPVPG